MIEGFGPNEESIQQLQMAAQNGRGVQAHARDGSVDVLAAFLVGAGCVCLFVYSISILFLFSFLMCMLCGFKACGFPFVF